MLACTTSQAATFYVRADGSATKSLATGPASDPAKCMSMTTCSASAFSGGDIVYFSGLGGAYTVITTNGLQVAVLLINSSGAYGNPITFTGIVGDTPIIDLTSNTNSGSCILASNQNYLNIANFDVKGNGTQHAVAFNGSSGAAGPGFTVTVTNVNVLENYGNDGFSSGQSVGATCQIRLVNCSATKCRESGVSVLSYQAVTAHEFSKLIAEGCTFSDCNYGYTGTKATWAAFTNCVISGMKLGSLVNFGSVGFTNALIFSDGFITNDAGAIPVQGFTNNSIYIKNSTIVSTSSLPSINKAHTTFDGCYFALDDASWSFRQASGNLVISNCVITVASNAGTNWFETVSSDSTIQAIRNKIILGYAGNSSVFWFGNTNAVTQKNLVAYNLFVNAENSICVVGVGSMASAPAICNNDFYSRSNATAVFNLQDGSETIGKLLLLKNNVFYGVSTVLNSPGQTNYVISNNCYYLSSNEGGTGSITTDPRFVSPGTDFRLLVQSPCINAGVDVGLTQDFYGRWVVGLPDMGACEYLAGPITHLIRMVPTN